MQEIEDYRGPHYSTLVKQDIAIIQLTGSVFEIGTDLELKSSFFSALDAMGASPEINAILLVGSNNVALPGFVWVA